MYVQPIRRAFDNMRLNHWSEADTLCPKCNLDEDSDTVISDTANADDPEPAARPTIEGSDVEDMNLSQPRDPPFKAWKQRMITQGVRELPEA